MDCEKIVVHTRAEYENADVPDVASDIHSIGARCRL